MRNAPNSDEELRRHTLQPKTNLLSRKNNARLHLPWHVQKQVLFKAPYRAKSPSSQWGEQASPCSSSPLDSSVWRKPIQHQTRVEGHRQHGNEMQASPHHSRMKGATENTLSLWTRQQALFSHLLPTLPPHLSFSTHTRTPTHKHIVTWSRSLSLSVCLLQSLYKGTDAFNWYRGGRHVSIHQVFNKGLRANRGQSLLQNIYRLFVAAIAMMFSSGCQPVCKIFLLKSKQSTLISSFLRFPPVHTFLSLSTVRGLVISRHASRVESRLDSLSNMRKKLLYEPVMMCLQRHSNNKNHKQLHHKNKATEY